MTDHHARDRRLLRDLAHRVREIAEEPVMEQRRQRWRRHNALQSDGPMVLCFPEGAWGEILPDSALQCQDPTWRGWERGLRSRIYWWEQINDDNTVEPWFDLGWKITVGDFGVDIPYHYGENRGSYVWDAPIKDLDRDLDRLHLRSPSVDRAGTAREADQAGELLGDILPVRIHSTPWWTVGLTWEAIKLVGLQNLMLCMYDQPKGLHRLMAFLRDDMMNYLTWCEREGLLSPNTGPADYVGSGGVGYTDELQKRSLEGEAPAEPIPSSAARREARPPTASQSARAVTLREMWGFAESQETVGVSEKMFAEFILPYQLPLLEKFGLNCYGCCEPVDLRADAILGHVPRLRRVSVAPLANQEKVARRLGRNYIFSRKPNPAHVCVGFNETAIRDDLRETLRVAGDLQLELIMKDTHTVEHQPDRLGRWVRIAREEIARTTA